jgi:phage virion morphogenesis protein
VEIDFTYSDALTAGLERGAAAHLDFSPALAAIKELMLRQVEQRFDLGEGPDGIAWLPSRRATDEGGKTLIDTRRLLGSIVGDHDSVSAIVGTNLIYAGIHQTGGKIRAKPKSEGGKGYLSIGGKKGGQAFQSVNMPARPFLGFGEEELEEIPALLAEFLGTAFGEGRA